MRYSYDRRAASKPPKRFRDGDAVEVIDDDGEVLDTGEIQFATSYDDYAETWKYKVRIKGTTPKTYNEKSLRLKK